MAVPSATVGSTSRGTALSTPAWKLASTGEQCSGCATKSLGKRRICPAASNSANPMAQPSTLLPAPAGITTLSGAWKPKSSHISYAMDFVPCRKNGCQLWLA
ncbi:hypothetical protein G6F31_021518 [Rhizopus arrhizus]|nr:hypothetical protein G6F31_021518 [Rhizopus arrhizus]